jgi:hypothetical protein
MADNESAYRAAVLFLLVITACRSDQVIRDDFGIAGYARLQGTVSRVDGSPWGGVTVSYSCGTPDPTWFGYQASADRQGSFNILVAAPAAGTLPESGTLLCEVRAPANSPPVARARAVTSFSQDEVSPPITTVNLVEGEGHTIMTIDSDSPVVALCAAGRAQLINTTEKI